MQRLMLPVEASEGIILQHMKFFKINFNFFFFLPHLENQYLSVHEV